MNKVYFTCLITFALLFCISCRKERVRINGQVWMQKNLDVEKFRNGDPIKEAKTDDEWILAAESEQPAWCYFENDPNNGEKFGKLYNWHAVKDPRGLAPEGWRLPTLEDFEFLASNLTENNYGYSLKSTSGWHDGQNGDNSSGFNAKPGGFRVLEGEFSIPDAVGLWWTVDQAETYNAYSMRLVGSNNGIVLTKYKKAYGLSVRCIRNN